MLPQPSPSASSLARDQSLSPASILKRETVHREEKDNKARSRFSFAPKEIEGLEPFPPFIDPTIECPELFSHNYVPFCPFQIVNADQDFGGAEMGEGKQKLNPTVPTFEPVEAKKARLNELIKKGFEGLGRSPGVKTGAHAMIKDGGGVFGGFGGGYGGGVVLNDQGGKDGGMRTDTVVQMGEMATGGVEHDEDQGGVWVGLEVVTFYEEAKITMTERGEE